MKIDFKKEEVSLSTEVGDVLILDDGRVRLIVSAGNGMNDKKVTSIDLLDNSICLKFCDIEELHSFYSGEISRIIKSQNLILNEKEV